MSLKIIQNGTPVEATKIWIGGEIQAECLRVWSTEANAWVYEALAEATGTLPLTFRSNGTALIDYRIYGNTVETTVKTANLVPLTTQKTATGSGITVTIDDSGVWHVTGTASQDVNILFDLEEAFTVPTALDNGGEGVIQFFNSVAMDDGSGNETARVLFYYGNFQRDYMGLHIQNRSITQYSDLANMSINRLGIWVKQGITCDFTLAPMVVDDGIVHDEYISPEITEVQGVGVRTENLFDPNAAETSGNNIISDFMPLDPSELVLTMAFDIPLRASYNYNVTYYDSTKTAISFVGGMGEAYKTRETVKLNRQSEAPNAAYVKVTLPKDLTNVLIQNGSTDGAYIPYGYKLPMVSRTENLFDYKNAALGYYLSYTTGNLVSSINSDTSDFIDVSDMASVTISLELYGVLHSIANREYALYNENKQKISTAIYVVQNKSKVTAVVNTTGASFIRFDYDKSHINVMLTEGSTAPDSYIPYHRTDTPIYIGDTQLMQDEHVSYSEQAIYKRTENLYDGTLLSSYFTSAYFARALYKPTVFKSIQVWLKAGVYIVVFDTDVAIIRLLVNGGYWQAEIGEAIITSHYQIECIKDGYIGLSFREATGTDVPFDVSKKIVVTGELAKSPPVPLPELPTFSDADTVLDYEETPAPEEVWVKYHKE